MWQLFCIGFSGSDSAKTLGQPSRVGMTCSCAARKMWSNTAGTLQKVEPHPLVPHPLFKQDPVGMWCHIEDIPGWRFVPALLRETLPRRADRGARRAMGNRGGANSTG